MVPGRRDLQQGDQDEAPMGQDRVGQNEVRPAHRRCADHLAAEIQDVDIERSRTVRPVAPSAGIPLGSLGNTEQACWRHRARDFDDGIEVMRLPAATHRRRHVEGRCAAQADPVVFKHRDTLPQCAGRRTGPTGEIGTEAEENRSFHRCQPVDLLRNVKSQSREFLTFFLAGVLSQRAWRTHVSANDGLCFGSC